ERGHRLGPTGRLESLTPLGVRLLQLLNVRGADRRQLASLDLLEGRESQLPQAHGDEVLHLPVLTVPLLDRCVLRRLHRVLALTEPLAQLGAVDALREPATEVFGTSPEPAPLGVVLNLGVVAA